MTVAPTFSFSFGYWRSSCAVTSVQLGARRLDVDAGPQPRDALEEEVVASLEGLRLEAHRQPELRSRGAGSGSPRGITPITW